MMDTVRREILVRRWMRSHEEDAGGQAVYRPAGWAFPPSRGRAGFDLRPDGTLLRLQPGPADRPRKARGRWRLEGDRLVLLGMGAGETPQTLKIVSASEDRLVVLA
jgi:hypothetical protein